MKISRYLRQTPFLKNVFYIILGSVVLYWIFLRRRKYHEAFETIIDSVEPRTVWEFTADFSNHQRINPTISNFEIEYEKGNYANWEYSVTYKEASSSMPFLKYNNRAIFKVLPKSSESPKSFSQPYRILSAFTSCIWNYCLESTGEMTFTQSNPEGGDSTKIQEEVQFDCPPILSLFCFSHLKAQKQSIFDNIANSVDMMNVM